MWRIGGEADVAWIKAGTEHGLGIASAIAPLFDAYATLEVPGTGAHAPAAWLEAPDRHAAGVLTVLDAHTTTQPWWWAIWTPGRAPTPSSTTCPG